ncbi:MAG: hypothetical protein RJB38_878 [Pseudomonadota bacterium]
MIKQRLRWGAFQKNRLWMATLLTGILGFTFLSTLQETIQTALVSRSRELLGADIALSARRMITAPELELARKRLSNEGEFRETSTLEFYSMASSEEAGPQLIELLATEKDFPLVGTVERESSADETNPADRVWTDPALAIRWNLKAGRTRVKIGDRWFRYQGRILRDTGRSLRGASLAPRVLISRNQLPSTGLLRAGATLTHRTYFSFSTALDSDRLAQLKTDFERLLEDPALQIQTPSDAADDEGRLLRQTGDYLAIASLVGLLLAFLGCFWLIKQNLIENAQTWAIYRVLSPKTWQADLPFIRQAALVSGASAALALALTQCLWILARQPLARVLFVDGSLDGGVSLRVAGLTLVLAMMTSLAALWPALAFLKRQSLSLLLRDPEVLAKASGMKFSEALTLVALLGLVARGVSHSWFVTGAFLSALLLSTAAIWALGALFLRTLRSLEPKLKTATARWSALSISRLTASSQLIWLTLCLSALLLSLMPTLESSFRAQLQSPMRPTNPLPSLFLFDIQEEQLSELETWAASESITLQYPTALIRGRLLRVNDTPFERIGSQNSKLLGTTREQEREARFRNRGLNLTIRAQLTPSETLVKGIPFSELPPPSEAPSESTPEALSVEERFADRLGLQLGDLLHFEIQGVALTGKIVNLRRVDWTSFQPNFFVVFRPGALNDAPKTYLASLPQASEINRERWQRLLFQRFPNVSSIDVTQLTETLLKGFSQISVALELMALVAALAGFAAIFSVLRLRARERQNELQLLKVLGASPRALSVTLFCEMGILSGIAAFFGVLLSFGVGRALAQALFHSAFRLADLGYLLFLPPVFALMGGTLGLAATARLVKRSPQFSESHCSS